MPMAIKTLLLLLAYLCCRWWKWFDYNCVELLALYGRDENVYFHHTLFYLSAPENNKPRRGRGGGWAADGDAVV